MKPKNKILFTLFITLFLLLFITTILASTQNQVEPNKSLLLYTKILNANLLGEKISENILKEICSQKNICFEAKEECYVENDEIVCVPHKEECTTTTISGIETTTCQPPKNICTTETICELPPTEECITQTTNKIETIICTPQKECITQTICTTPQECTLDPNCTQVPECITTTISEKESTTCTPEECDPSPECTLQEECTTLTTDELTITQCTIPENATIKQTLLELLPNNEQTKYFPLILLKDNTPIVISLPVYPENIVPPYYCARYVRFLGQQLFGDCYPSANAWDIRYKTTVNVYKIKEDESPSTLIQKGVLKEGFLLGVHTPHSVYNTRLDIQGNPIAYTHVVMYVGNSLENKPLFIDLFYKDIRILSEEVLLNQFEIVEVLSIKREEGVNKTCFLEPDQIQSREEYYDTLLESIKYEESGRNNTGVRKFLSKMWEGIHLAKSYGPYQTRLSIVRSLIDQKKLPHVFGDTLSKNLSNNQIIKKLEDPITAKQIAITLLESNESVILAYNTFSKYVCKRPDHGSLDRYALEGAAYNSGVSTPIIAGFKYSLYKAGAEFEKLDEQFRFSGKITHASKEIIEEWAKEKNVLIDFGEHNSTTNSYPTALTKLLKNEEFMKKFFEEYSASTGEKCIPLFIPYKDIKEVKVIDGINYGFRVATR